MAAPIPEVIQMDTEQTADPQVKIVVVPPIFMLDEYCWDQITTHLSMTDVIMMEIADCRFRKAALRKIAVLKQHVLNSTGLKNLSEYTGCDEFLGMWADQVTDLFIGGHGDDYNPEFDAAWFKFLPHFKNLSRLVWFGVVLDSKQHLPMLPTGLTSLALVNCQIAAPLMKAWLKKLNPTLTDLEYFVYERCTQPQLLALKVLKNIETLTTDEYAVLEYLPIAKLQKLSSPRDDCYGMRYMTDREWKNIIQAPKLKIVSMGQSMLPHVNEPPPLLLLMGQRGPEEEFFEPPLVHSQMESLSFNSRVWFNCKAISRLVNLKFLKLSGHAFEWENLLHLSRLEQLEVLVIERVDESFLGGKQFVTTDKLTKLIQSLTNLKTLKLDGKLKPDYLAELNDYLVSCNRTLELATPQKALVSLDNLKHSVFEGTPDEPHDPYSLNYYE